ncbi:MAG TPA: hypothetical protein VFP61_13465, partial [Acidimicrobiales bacterium]|nr:hypothetical protein [Acidimicrobiales bacterium]
MALDPVALRDASDLAGALARRELSSRELLAAQLARVEALDGDLGAVVTLTADRAAEEAAACDEDLAAGRRRGPLHG